MPYDRNKQDELDTFWDIDRLLPKRAKSVQAPKHASDVSATEIQVPPVQATPSHVVQDQPLTHPTRRVINGDTSLADHTVHYVPPHSAAETVAPQSPCDEYVTSGNLIHRVQVFDWPSGYHYFEQFFKEAVALSDKQAAPAQSVPFFSYFPQYDQLSKSQMAWYLYWRAQVRGGIYPRTDYAYILLYVFELINLPAEGPSARDHAARMADVWLAYRDEFPQLDHYVSEWLCDYCLIHHLDAPPATLSLVADDLTPLGSLREFYLNHSTLSGDSDTATRVLLSHCCSYDFRKSKFAAGPYRELFYDKIPATVAAVLPLLLGTGHTEPLIHMQDSTVTRDAYTGALCAYMHKRRIKVYYTSFSRSHELRFLIGDIVRHTENRLRTWIGVRSKLSVMSLPPSIRDAVDAYLAPQAITLTEHIRAKAADRPAYERQYDLPTSDTVISAQAAKQIEQASWSTTQVLTEAFAEADERPTAAAALPTEPASKLAFEPTPPPAPSMDTPLAEALGELSEFVRLCLQEDTAGQLAFARRIGQLPDAVADRINEITCDTVIFDMVLEEMDGGFGVVEDYRATLTEQLHL